MNTLKRPDRQQRNRKAATKGREFTGFSPHVVTAVFDTPDIVLTFDRAVVLNGVPQYLTNTAKLPTTAVQDSATQVTLTYDTPGSVTTFTVPQQDPALRSNTGGLVASGTFPTSAP